MQRSMPMLGWFCRLVTFNPFLKFAIIAACLLALTFSSHQAASAATADWPQFRGPKRDGISTETGLLKTWPKDGPRVVWKAAGVGQGFSSVSIADARVYTMGDLKDSSHVFALSDKDGQPLWSAKVGKTGGNYKGPRSTPTVDGALVYALGQFGDLVCLKADSGEEVWRKNLPSDFGGKSGGWNYTESVLIDGDRLICTPGGKDAVMVALDKKTGEEIWRGATGGNESAGYASAVIANIDNVRMYVQLLSGGAAAFDAKDGKLLWRYGDKDNRFKGNTANIPTPTVKGNEIFFSAGYGRGGALVKVAKVGDQFVAEEIYFNKALNNKHGGVIWLGDYLYGDSDDSGRPFCADAKTGKVIWRRERQGDGSGSVAVTAADGNIIFRYQNGVVALVPASSSGYEETSSFKIEKGTDPSWPHPVVAGGRLYLRDQDHVWCHDLTGK